MDIINVSENFNTVEISYDATVIKNNVIKFSNSTNKDFLIIEISKISKLVLDNDSIVQYENEETNTILATKLVFKSNQYYKLINNDRILVSICKIGNNSYILLNNETYLYDVKDETKDIHTTYNPDTSKTNYDIFFSILGFLITITISKNVNKIDFTKFKTSSSSSLYDATTKNYQLKDYKEIIFKNYSLLLLDEKEQTKAEIELYKIYEICLIKPTVLDLNNIKRINYNKKKHIMSLQNYTSKGLCFLPYNENNGGYLAKIIDYEKLDHLTLTKTNFFYSYNYSSNNEYYTTKFLNYKYEEKDGKLVVINQNVYQHPLEVQEKYDFHDDDKKTNFDLIITDQEITPIIPINPDSGSNNNHEYEIKITYGSVTITRKEEIIPIVEIKEDVINFEIGETDNSIVILTHDEETEAKYYRKKEVNDDTDLDGLEIKVYDDKHANYCFPIFISFFHFLPLYIYIYIYISPFSPFLISLFLKKYLLTTFY